MTTFDDQYFFQTQLVNPTDMNKFYQNVADKLTAYFPVVPCICHGVTYTQTGTSNIFRFAKGMIRFKDQSNPLSAAQSQVQATFANIDVADVTVSCPDASGNYYIVALLTMTQVSPSQVIFSATILPTSMTLAQIAETGKPNLYLPLYRITNTNGIYALSVNSACAVNAYYSLKLEGTPTAPTAPPGTNTDQLATTAFANGVTPVNTKYDFIVTGDNTPTFAAGEEYILYPNNISGYVEFELTFLGGKRPDSIYFGDVTARFSLDRIIYTDYSSISIKLLSLGQSGSFQNLVNLFTFTSYFTTAPYIINGVTIPTGAVIYTIKLNNALTYAGTTNSIYAKVSSNAINANNVMNGALAPAVLGIVSTPIPALAMTEEGEDEIVGATAVIKADNALFQSSMDSNNFGTDPTTGLTKLTNFASYFTTISPVANNLIWIVPTNTSVSCTQLDLNLSWDGNSIDVGATIFRGRVYINSYTCTLGSINTIPLFNTLFTFGLANNNSVSSGCFLKSLTAIIGLQVRIKYVSDFSTPVENSLLIGTIFTPTTAVTLINNPWASQAGIDTKTINVNAVTGLTQVKPYFSKYKYVDPVDGLDTNIGSYNAPYKTMLYSVTNNPTGTIHILMGQSTEAAFSIPVDKTNIDIIAQGTRSALNGFTNKVTVLGTGAGSVRFQDLNFGGGLTRAATCTCGIYVYDGSIGAAGFIQSGNGYTEISQTDASNGVNTISAGTTVFYGGKAIAPVITGTGTVVTMDNVGTVIGNGTMAAGGTLYAFESNWIAAATGHAITAATGTVTTMQGCNFIRPNGTLASVSVTNYDIQNTDFDKVNSVLGTHIGNYDWYAKLGLLNADTITTATKMLVRKPTGEIAEQVIPLAGQGYQFDSIMGSGVYVDAVTEQVLMLRNGSGTSQWMQNVLVCNSSGLMSIGQQFSAEPQSGQTVNVIGKMTFYNTNTITTANYYVNIQVIGLTSGGQLVNLGTSKQTVLSKTQYAYTVATFSSGAQLLTTNLVAVGIQAQLLYGEANNTVLCNTLAAQMTVS